MLSLTRRQFLQAAGAGAATLLVTPRLVLAQAGGPFTLPPLPYPYDALKKAIDEQTMKIHHDLHHKAYVDNLNKAIEAAPELKGKSIEAILRNIDKAPEKVRQAIINNGGGHANHSLFWEVMTPSSTEPKGKLADAIKSTFGGVDKVKELMSQAGMTRFGSGWSWLVVGKDGKLQIYSTANQDSPLMKGDTPILGLDVWEHAYYLRYQNRRGDYVKAWWDVVNWDNVGQRFEKAVKG